MIIAIPVLLIGLVIVLGFVAFNSSKGGEDIMNTVVKMGLGIAIAVVFPLMVGLGIEAFYPSPEDPYEHCRYAEPSCEGKTQCPDPMKDATYKACYDEQKIPVSAYNRNLFIATTIIGFVTIAGGALYLSEAMGPVAPGLVFGGLLTILYGTIRGLSFEAVDKRWLFLELLIVLAGLILVTRRYLSITAKEKK